LQETTKNSTESEKLILTREEKKERNNARRRAWRAVNRKKSLQKNKVDRDLTKEKTILQRAEKTKAYNAAHYERKLKFPWL